MSGLSLLTKQAEDRILAGIREAVRHVDAGLHPTDAVVKAAEGRGWSDHFIDRVCQAYNTGCQEAQRKNASTALSKFASFPLADPDEVRSRLGAEKSAAVSEDYSRPPDWLPAVVEEPAPEFDLNRVKAAAVEAPAEKCVVDVHRRAEDLARKTAQASLDADTVLDLSIRELQNYFRPQVGYRLPFGEVKQAAEAYYGKPALWLLDKTAAALRLKVENVSEKQAAFRPVQHNAAPYTLIARCLELGDQAVAARNKAAAAAEELEAAEVLIKEARESFQQAGATPPTLLGKTASYVTGAAVASGTRALFDNLLKGTPAAKTDDQLIDKTWLKLDNPGHDEELRKIRAQSMLSDLMANDEVIRGYRPEEVLSAYNELQSMMPSLATQPAVMRPYLRRRLAGNMETFEAGEMNKLESERRRQTAAPATIHMPSGSPTAGVHLV